MADVPRSLPGPVLPDFGRILPLTVPAVSLAFVGLVQGTGISARQNVHQCREEYAESLRAVGSKLVIVSANDRVVEQLTTTRVLDVVHHNDVCTSDEWVGRTVRRAHDDALDWIEANRES